MGNNEYLATSSSFNKVRYDFPETPVITIKLAGDVKQECQILTTFAFEEKDYVAMMPTGTEICFIFKYDEHEDYFTISSISQSELKKVAPAFQQLYIELTTQKSNSRSSGKSFVKGLLKVGTAVALGAVVGEMFEGDFEIGEENAMDFDDFGGNLGDFDFDADGIISDEEFQAATNSWMNDVQEVDPLQGSIGNYDFDGDNVLSNVEFQAATKDWMDGNS